MRAARGRFRRLLVATGAGVLVTLAVAAPAPATERSGAGFDADEGLGGRDIVAVLASYDDAAGRLEAQVFFAAAPSAQPPAELVVTFSALGLGGACSPTGGAVITTATTPEAARTTLTLPGLGAPSVAVQRGAEGEAIDLAAVDARLAGRAFGCVQVTTRSGSGATIDALSQPVPLADVGGAPDAPLDLGLGLGADDPLDAGAPLVRFRLVRTSLGRLARRRLAITATLSAPGSVTASLRLGAARARKLRVPRVIARGAARASAPQRLRVVLRPRRSALARLDRGRPVRATLLIGAGRAGGDFGFVRRRVTLR